MKRHGDLMPAILEWDNLLLAHARAARGLSKKGAAERYARRLDDNLRDLREGLKSGHFYFGRFHRFEVRDPKLRTICAPEYPARVAHHAIFNVCEPLLERRLISDCYACRRGRGTHGAIRRALQFARKHPWSLELDVKRFFDSIPHQLLLENLARVFKDRKVLRLFASILKGYHTEPGKGLPIGSLSSQHFANFYLSCLDRFVKEKLRVRGYVRYMDDFILWGHERIFLTNCRNGVECKLNEIGLRLKKRSEPKPSQEGLGFLGHRIFPRRVELDRRARTRFVRKARRLTGQWNEGAISSLELQQRHASLAGYGVLADLRRLHSAIEKKGTTLWRETGGRLQPCLTRGLVEQQGEERPLREPEQERAGQPEQQPGLPPQLPDENCRRIHETGNKFRSRSWETAGEREQSQGSRGM
tara:strand:+ start:1078 stop:2322 length:1245 start_codon:yes stop_codon:yes gene_type:complete